MIHQAMGVALTRHGLMKLSVAFRSNGSKSRQVLELKRHKPTGLYTAARSSGLGAQLPFDSLGRP